VFVVGNNLFFAAKIRVFAKETYFAVKRRGKFKKFSNFFHFSLDLFALLK
jgi:hypothetical protein